MSGNNRLWCSSVWNWSCAHRWRCFSASQHCSCYWRTPAALTGVCPQSQRGIKFLCNHVSERNTRTSSGEMMSLKLRRSSSSGKLISHVFGKFNSLMSEKQTQAGVTDSDSSSGIKDVLHLFFFHLSEAHENIWSSKHLVCMLGPVKKQCWHEGLWTVPKDFQLELEPSPRPPSAFLNLTLVFKDF